MGSAPHLPEQVAYTVPRSVQWGEVTSATGPHPETVWYGLRFIRSGGGPTQPVYVTPNYTGGL